MRNILQRVVRVKDINTLLRYINLETLFIYCLSVDPEYDTLEVYWEEITFNNERLPKEQSIYENNDLCMLVDRLLQEVIEQIDIGLSEIVPDITHSNTYPYSPYRLGEYGFCRWVDQTSYLVLLEDKNAI